MKGIKIKVIYRWLSVLTVIVITGCGGLTAKNMISNKNTPNYETEGIIALKLYASGTGFPSMKPNHTVQVIIREVNSQQYVNLNSNNKRVRTFRLPAGEYYFWSVTGDFFVQREFETSSYLPDKSLPIKTFTVEAGKGLSLGEILLEDFKYGEHITYDDDHINYTITNNFEEDLTAIKAAYPDFKGEIIDGTLQLME